MHYGPHHVKGKPVERRGRKASGLMASAYDSGAAGADSSSYGSAIRIGVVSQKSAPSGSAHPTRGAHTTD